MAGIGTFGGIGDIVLYLGVVDAGFSNKLAAAKMESEKLASNIQNVMNKAIIAGGAAFATATVAAANFQKQMSLVDTLLGGANRTVAQLSEEVLNYAQTSSQSIAIITKALYDTVSAGVQASDAMNVVALSAKAAGAGFTTVEIAGRAGIATMNAFGKSADDLSHIFDLQFAAVKYGVLTYEELATNIGDVLPAAAALGASLEDMYGSLAFLTKMGQNADMATTNLSRAFQSLVEQQDKLANINVEIWDKQTGKFLGMDTVIRQLAKTMEGMTDQQRMATLEALNFDIRAGRAINTMVLNYEAYSKTLKDVANSHDILDDAYSRMTNNLERQAKIFKNIVQVSFIETGQQLLPLLTSILKLFNEHPEAIKTVVRSFTEVAVVVGTIAAGYKAYQLGANLVARANALMSSSFGPIAIAITGVAAAISLLRQHIEKSKEEQEKYYENLAKGVLKIEELEAQYKKLTETTIDIDAAHKRTEEAQKKLNEAIASGSGDIEKLKKAYEEARQAEQDAILLKSKIQDVTLKLNEAYKQQGIVVKNLGKDYGDLSESQRKIKYDELVSELERLQKQFDIVSKKTNEYRQGWIELTTGKYIEAAMVPVSETVKNKELEIIANEMQRVRDAIDQLRSPSQDLAQRFEEIGKMSEESREKINAKISALTELYNQSSDNAQISATLEKEIDRLKNKLVEGANSVNNLAKSQNILSEAGIETTAMVQNQIANLESLIPLVKNDEYAMGQLADQVVDLYTKIGKTQDIQKFINKLENQLKGMDSSSRGAKALTNQIAELYLKLGKVDEWNKIVSGTDSYRESMEKAKQVTGEIRNSYAELEPRLITLEDLDAKAKEAQEKLNAQFSESVQKAADYSDQLADAIEKNDLFGNKTKLVVNVIRDFADDLKKAKDESDIFGSTVEGIGQLIQIFSEKTDKASQTIGLLTSALGTVLRGGFDPVSLGISVITGLISIFSTEEEKVVRTTEQVIESLGSLGEQIENTKELIDSLSNKFESDYIEDIRKWIDYYIEALRTATGETRKRYEEQLAIWQGYMNAILQPFQLSDEFKKVLEGLDYVTQYVIDSIAQFGEAANKSSLTNILQEQILAAAALLEKLDPASKAYQDLSEKIEGAVKQMIAMNGTVNILGNEVDAAAFHLTALIASLGGLEKGSDAWKANYDVILIYAQAMLEAGKLTDDLVRLLKDVGIELDTMKRLEVNIRDIGKAADEIQSDGIGSLPEAFRAVAISISELDDKFQKNSKSLDKVTDEIKRLYEYYGGFDAQNLINQLQEQIILNMQLLDQLPRNSKAYADLAKQIFEAYRQMLAMGGSSEAIVRTAQVLGIDLKELTNIYTGLSAINADVNQSLREQVKQMRNVSDNVITASERLEKLNNQLSNAKVLAEKLQQMRIEITAEYVMKRQDLESRIAELKAELQKLRDEKLAVNIDFDIKIEKLSYALGNIQQIAELLGRGELGAEGLFEISELIEQLTGKSLSLIGVWEGPFQHTFSLWDNFNKELKESGEILDDMSFFGITSDMTAMDDSILATIFRWKGFLDQLSPDSLAYQQGKKALDELILKFFEIANSSNAGYQSFLRLKSEIDTLTATISELSDKKIQIDIDTEKAIKSLESDKDALSKKLSELEEKRVELDIKFKMDREALIAQIADLQDQLQALLDERQAIMVNLVNSAAHQNAIERMEKYQAIQAELIEKFAIEQAGGVAVNFYEIAKAIDELTQQSSELTIQWGEMLETMLGEYDTFEKNLKTATEGLEKLIYFGIDLSTTSVDEQIGYAIIKMQDYLETLNPESQAYKDAKEALDELIQKFTDIGGVIDRSGLYDQLVQATEQGSSDAAALIEKMLQEAAQQQLKLDADISEVQNKIAAIDAQLAVLAQKYEQDKIQLDIDIANTLDQIDAIDMQIIALREAAEAEKIQIDLEISAAQQKLAELQAQFNAIDLTQFLNQQAAVAAAQGNINLEISNLMAMLQNLVAQKNQYNITIDAKIADAEVNLDKLEQELAMLISDYGDMVLQLDVNIANALNSIEQLKNAIQALNNQVVNFTASGASIFITVTPETMHSGGYVGGYLAHSGGDIPAILQRGEYVIQKDTVAKFDRKRWDLFNLTANPAILLENSNRKEVPVTVDNHFDVIIHSADPNAWAEIINRKIAPGVNRVNRKFVVSENPYNI